jgi:predicted dehydrogenase
MNRKNKNNLTRKTFIKKAGVSAAGLFSAPFFIGSGKQKEFNIPPRHIEKRSYSANDHINVALIGAGDMGQGDAETAREVDGIKIIAACDLYDSRLRRCKERFGDDTFTTKDYRDILSREDVDAVINGTTDHWHEQITSDALKAGKAVYLEKPMVQHIEEGHRLIEVEKETGTPLIVGSQRVSSIIYEKTRDLLQAGEIGELNFVEGYWDRQSAIGAWQYSIPPSASPENVDWETYLKDLPKIPFDAEKFFRWRNYRDFGTGVAGDLFVHLFSGLHLITGSNGPNRVMSTGGIRYWEDGRDVPDVMLGIYDYAETELHPAFNLALRVNFADGSGGGHKIRLIGSEGELEIAGNSVILRKSKLPEAPGMSIRDFDEKIREEYQEYYEEKYPEKRAEIIEPSEFVYKAPDGYNDRYDHFVNFFDAIRHGKNIIEDGTFGLRAAGPALASNISHFEKRQVNWDPERMEVL